MLTENAFFFTLSSLAKCRQRSVNSAVECYLHTVEVTSSILVPSTFLRRSNPSFFYARRIFLYNFTAVNTTCAAQNMSSMPADSSTGYSQSPFCGRMNGRIAAAPAGGKYRFVTFITAHTATPVSTIITGSATPHFSTQRRRAAVPRRPHVKKSMASFTGWCFSFRFGSLIATKATSTGGTTKYGSLSSCLSCYILNTLICETIDSIP